MHVCVCVFGVVLHNNESEQEAKQKQSLILLVLIMEKITSKYSRKQLIFI